MNELVVIGVLFLAMGLWGGLAIWKMRRELQSLRVLVANAGLQSPPPLHINKPTEQPVIQTPILDPTPLSGAGSALANPPREARILLDELQGKGTDAYRFPLGWYSSFKGATLQTAQFVRDVNHILLTGQSDSGKDNAALGMLLSLALTKTPQQCQFAIVDGKGLDWLAWEKKDHTWLLATDPEHIEQAMMKLTAERQRRRAILADAGVTKWDKYTGKDLPLLVVFISELLLLENAVGKSQLTGWLNAELTAARAFGIRYIIATQTASNFSTQWRSQISLFMAGFQPSPSQDAPNVGLTTNELDALHVVAPSSLPSPNNQAGGVFCVVQGNQALNVRTTLIDDRDLDYLMECLPNRVALAQKSHDELLTSMLAIAHQNGVKALSTHPEALQTATQQSSVTHPSEALPVATHLVPADEQRRILAVAARATSRRAVCREVYNAVGGTGYNNVRLVCDAAGLLMPTPTAMPTASAA
ncbi:cell divisionFtsK/SpoIIIE (plasmid) [Herpetosiphon aurantiacus DSM 785]|uniref:Cell divisionFtsK/SpoIIIE n=1 Tax=Herpetosiphon aurantiacus (strain ATCC 23779 / DSM 785 / 114-95) TaxID=316274 RepID=A9B8H3_HERA2|nr:cell divisionFtsK/SpoIIIE [Herpetosiphon aurantiacus DSM 785]